MAINGIEIQVGQKWRTRGGAIVEIQRNDGHENWPWDHTLGSCGYDGFESHAGDKSDSDLIELVEHADSFKPWAGGEQPEETRGKLVAYRLGNSEQIHREADLLHWGAPAGGGFHIVAYKVVGEATRLVPDPLHGELIEPPQDALDVQVGGDHYKSLAIQPVEYIHANKIGYFEGNVIKYVTRWRAKNGVADLEKAKHYIDLLIELEGGAK